jgi:hypothetical protein
MTTLATNFLVSAGATYVESKIILSLHCNLKEANKICLKNSRNIVETNIN